MMNKERLKRVITEMKKLGLKQILFCSFRWCNYALLCGW